MAVDTKALRKKYGINLDKAGGYSAMFSEILAEARQTAMTESGRRAQDQIGRQAKVKPPTINFTIPANKKAQRQSKIIRENLKKELMRNFKRAAEEHRKAGGKAIEYREGQPGLHTSFKDRLFGALHRVMDSFINPTPGMGLPGALAGIVSTETGSALNDGVDVYINRYREDHPSDTIFKTWKQHRELSAVPRKNHALVNNKTLRWEAPFKVPDGKGGFDFMDRPHAPNAPLGNVINCHCTLDFKIK
jgi:hypothetical protein